MINIVIDTNVVISAMLTPTGTASKITSILSSTERINVFYSAEILSEYKKVLKTLPYRIFHNDSHKCIDVYITKG